MLYAESGDLLADLLGGFPGTEEVLEALDPKTEMGTKDVLDCGGGNFVTYPKGTIDPYTAQVCGCAGAMKGGKLYGMEGLWPCPEIWGGTGNSYWQDHPAQGPAAAEPWTTTPKETLEDIDAIFAEPLAEGSGKPKKAPAPAPGVAIVPAPGGLGAAGPGIPWWIWALVAGGGAWFLLRKKGA